MASREKVILILQNTNLSSTPNIIIVVFVDAPFADLKACNFLCFPPIWLQKILLKWQYS